jgi:hypothetical protein
MYLSFLSINFADFYPDNRLNLPTFVDHKLSGVKDLT